jgi:SPP1 gp7 family putative phage head morphogenesis protein
MLYRDLIREQVRERAEALRKRGRKLPRGPKPKEPHQLTRVYLRELLDQLGFARALVKAALPSITRSLERANAVRAGERADATKADDDVGDVQKKLGDIRFAFMRRYSKAEAERLAERHVARGRNFTAEQVQQHFRKVIGVDVIAESPAMEQVVSAAVAENVSLITSIPEKYFADVESSVMQSFRTGANTDDLVDLLQERYEVSESRASLIAVDQTNKLNGQLQQVSQESLGVTRYIWRTSQDDRVRDSHQLLDGQSFSWDDPPEVGHPGQDYRCRCQPEADIESMLDDPDE